MQKKRKKQQIGTKKAKQRQNISTKKKKKTFKSHSNTLIQPLINPLSTPYHQALIKPLFRPYRNLF